MANLFARNEGTLDRGVRVVAGTALLLSAFVGQQTPWGFIGIVPLATGLLGSCPLYSVLGVNTCPVPKR